MDFLDCQIQMPLMLLPVRSFVVPVSGGRLLISPGSKLTTEQLRSAGEITDIIAPNLLHCGGMAQAISVFPKARVWGVRGAKEHKPEIPWTDFLGSQEWPYKREIDFLTLEGMPRFNEAVFFHFESKTLIVTDLFFNLTNSKGLGARLIQGLFGTYQKFALSRLYKSMIKDREAFKASMRQVLQWPFERIVMSHGELVSTQAKEKVLGTLQDRGLQV